MVVQIHMFSISGVLNRTARFDAVNVEVFHMETLEQFIFLLPMKYVLCICS